jgi:hypothetical protein
LAHLRGEAERRTREHGVRLEAAVSEERLSADHGLGPTAVALRGRFVPAGLTVAVG